MFSAIVCVDSKMGISKDGTIPWYISEDLKFFKSKTMGKTVFMGRKTFESLPCKLNGRNVIVMTKTQPLTDDFLKKHNEAIIAGGEEIYNFFQYLFDKIYITVIEKDYKCDKFFPKIPQYFKLVEFSERKYNEKEDVYYRFLTYKKQYINDMYSEVQYINLCNKILEEGVTKQDRTGTGTVSSFGNKIEFNINDGFVPMMTTKRLAWKSCINELLWFLRGSTNVKELQDVKCNIWNGNTSKEYKESVGLGHLLPEDCGKIYGFNWRHFGAEYKDCYTDYTGKGFDQIEYLVNELKNNPNSRRLLLNSWDPTSMKEGILPPCHMAAQFYVDGDKLSCQMYQRSADVFLGVPFNIFSYTVLTYILAMKTGLKPHKLIMVFGDTHIYNDHIEQVKIQVERNILTKPLLKLSDSIKNKDWKDITINDFEVIGYFSHPSIKANMSC